MKKARKGWEREKREQASSTAAKWVSGRAEVADMMTSIPVHVNSLVLWRGRCVEESNCPTAICDSGTPFSSRQNCYSSLPLQLADTSSRGGRRNIPKLVLTLSLAKSDLSFKFPRSLTRNITSLSRKNMAFHSLLRLQYSIVFWKDVHAVCLVWGTILAVNVLPWTMHSEGKKTTHIVWGVTKSRTLRIVFRVVKITTPHRVCNRVYILRIRFEKGCGKSYILVWNRVRVSEPGGTIPHQNNMGGGGWGRVAVTMAFLSAVHSIARRSVEEQQITKRIWHAGGRWPGWARHNNGKHDHRPNKTRHTREQCDRVYSTGKATRESDAP